MPTFTQTMSTGVEPVNAFIEPAQTYTALQPIQEYIALRPLHASTQPDQTAVQPIQTAVQPIQSPIRQIQPAVQPSQTAVEMVQTSIPIGAVFSQAELNAMQSQLFNLVRNDQDQKIIDNQTTIDITLKNLDLYRELNLSSMVQQQMAQGALR